MPNSSGTPESIHAAFEWFCVGDDGRADLSSSSSGRAADDGAVDHRYIPTCQLHRAVKRAIGNPVPAMIVDSFVEEIDRNPMETANRAAFEHLCIRCELARAPQLVANSSQNVSSKSADVSVAVKTLFRGKQEMEVSEFISAMQSQGGTPKDEGLLCGGARSLSDSEIQRILAGVNGGHVFQGRGDRRLNTIRAEDVERYLFDAAAGTLPPPSEVGSLPEAGARFSGSSATSGVSSLSPTHTHEAPLPMRNHSDLHSSVAVSEVSDHPFTNQAATADPPFPTVAPPLAARPQPTQQPLPAASGSTTGTRTADSSQKAKQSKCCTLM